MSVFASFKNNSVLILNTKQWPSVVWLVKYSTSLVYYFEQALAHIEAATHSHTLRLQPTPSASWLYMFVPGRALGPGRCRAVGSGGALRKTTVSSVALKRLPRGGRSRSPQRVVRDFLF